MKPSETHFVGLRKDGHYCVKNLKEKGAEWNSESITFVGIICAGRIGCNFEKLVTFEVPESLLKDGHKRMSDEDIEKFKHIVVRSLSRCSVEPKDTPEANKKKTS